MKIAIAGAGWYGCHIGSTLKNNGFEVKIFEKNSEIFGEASSNNQYRLHQGLHYARSSLTRHQSRDGFFRFVERYPYFSQDVENNLYLVPEYESLLDFDTYFSIMFSSGIKVDKLNLSELPYLDRNKFQGLIRCQEKILLNNKAKKYFQKELSSVLYTNTKIDRFETTDDGVIINGEKFDYFIDATWGSIVPIEGVFYEPTLLLYYRCKVKDFPAITLVDGQLWSIYPTDKPDIFTLSSVTHTPIGVYVSKRDAYNKLNDFSTYDLESKRKSMEEEVKPYFHDFKSIFEFVEPQFSIKTKHVGKTDDRHADVIKSGRTFSVCSGKVDNIFQASDYILGQLMKDTL